MQRTSTASSTQRHNHHHLRHPPPPPPQVNRHHWNALKYFVSLTVVISSNLPASEFKVWLWAACAVAATVFSSYWDFKFDFGLGDPNYGFLRRNLSIRPRFLGTNVYYVVVVLNVFLRCSWVLSITSPGAMGITVDTELLKVCLGAHACMMRIACLVQAARCRSSFFAVFRLFWLTRTCSSSF